MNENGEICIRGGNVMDGYENNPAANYEGLARVGCGQATLATWTRTDICSSGGESRKSSTVEARKSRHGRSTRYCCAIRPSARRLHSSLPHPNLGEDVLRPWSSVKDTQSTEHALRQCAAATLANFKVPRAIVFVKRYRKDLPAKSRESGWRKNSKRNWRLYPTGNSRYHPGTHTSRNQTASDLAAGAGGQADRGRG